MPSYPAIVPGYSTLVPRISIPLYPGYLCPRTPVIRTLVPRIFISSYPGYSYPRTPDIQPSYPGYSYPRTPAIHTLLPWLLIPSYPGYSYPFTPDIHTLVPGQQKAIPCKCREESVRINMDVFIRKYQPVEASILTLLLLEGSCSCCYWSALVIVVIGGLL